jgi:hypothetical protein
MKMRVFGFFFLLSFLVHAILRILERMGGSPDNPWVIIGRTVTSWFGAVVEIVSIVTLFLACFKKLKPVKIFVMSFIFYVIYVGFYIVSVFALAQKGRSYISRGEELPSPETTSLSQELAWYGPALWVILVTWIILGLYNLYAYGERFEIELQKTDEPKEVKW